MNYLNESLNTDPSPEQYDIIATRITPDNIRFLHALMGLQTESAELTDMFKKHVFYGKDFDLVNLVEELGDIEWYRAIMFSWLSQKLGITAEELEARVQNTNLNKLKARYPNKFTDADANERNLEAEREILESF